MQYKISNRFLCFSQHEFCFCCINLEKTITFVWIFNKQRMKKDIHPKNYRLVAFKDMSNNDIFITKSTAPSKENIKVEGKEYPLVKLEISRTSHPYYTGKSNLVDTAGRIDKFKTKYGQNKTQTQTKSE